MGFSSFLRSIGNSIKNTVNQIIDTGRDICNGIIDRIDIWRGREEEVRKRKEKERQMEIEREKARQREIERMKEEERERERQRQIQQMREAAERRERERLREIKKKYNNYRPSHVDQQLAQKAKTYIDKKFPNGVRETMRNTPPRKREELFNEVVNDACEIMDVRLNSVHYDEMKGNTAGIYRGRDNSLHLNAYMVTSEHPELAEDRIYTIFHELIHARQYEAALTRNDHGYSREQCLEWAYNFRNYIDPEENDEAYRKQPLERDAYGFVALMRGKISAEDLIKASQL